MGLKPVAPRDTAVVMYRPQHYRHWHCVLLFHLVGSRVHCHDTIMSVLVCGLVGQSSYMIWFGSVAVNVRA